MTHTECPALPYVPGEMNLIEDCMSALRSGTVDDGLAGGHAVSYPRGDVCMPVGRIAVPYWRHALRCCRVPHED